MATIITGKNTVYNAIKAGRKVFELYLQEGTTKGFVDLAKREGITYQLLSKQALNKKLPHNHQGVGAKVEDYHYKTLEDVLYINKENKLFLMLDGLEDPHNLGAILRSSDAFGVDAIILPKHKSVSLSNTVAKVSTGAIEYVNTVQVNNLNKTIETLKEQGFWIVGTDMDTDKTIHDIDVNTNLCVVIGSEGKGISRLVKQNCDYMVNIPMTGHVNSLNASVSAALVIYDIVHRKG